jgi:hypothetical protein
VLAAITLALFALISQGAISTEAHRDAPPDALAPSIRSSLATGGVRVTASGVQLDFWLVTSLPLKGSGAAWAAVEEGTLVGAIRVASDFRDIRGRQIKPGVYTLRYALQPQNGDHLGVSPFREFLLLSPAGVDTDPGVRGHDGTVEMSKSTVGGSHPGVWSIDPPSANAAPLTMHTTELGHKAVIVEVPLAGGSPLRFGIVLVGKIDA